MSIRTAFTLVNLLILPLAAAVAGAGCAKTQDEEEPGGDAADAGTEPGAEGVQEVGPPPANGDAGPQGQADAGGTEVPEGFEGAEGSTAPEGTSVFWPFNGPPGAVIVLKGQDFPIGKGEPAATFGGVPAQILGVAKDGVTVLVPHVPSSLSPVPVELTFGDELISFADSFAITGSLGAYLADPSKPLSLDDGEGFFLDIPADTFLGPGSVAFRPMGRYDAVAEAGLDIPRGRPFFAFHLDFPRELRAGRASIAPAIRLPNPGDLAIGDTVTLWHFEAGSSGSPGTWKQVGTSFEVSEDNLAAGGFDIDLTSEGLYESGLYMLVRDRPGTSIAHIEPAILGPNENATIFGAGFGSEIGSLTIGGEPVEAADIIAWTDTRIDFRVSFALVGGRPQVTPVGGDATNGPEPIAVRFGPYLAAAEPGFATAGSLVTLRGGRFGSAAEGSLSAGGVTVAAEDILAWSASEITFRYPDGAGGPDITLATGGTETSISLIPPDVAASLPAPQITGLASQPGDLRPGDYVVIEGTGFDAAPAQNLVFVGGVRATPVATTGDGLLATVPMGIAAGNITVIAPGGQADGAEDLPLADTTEFLNPVSLQPIAVDGKFTEWAPGAEVFEWYDIMPQAGRLSDTYAHYDGTNLTVMSDWWAYEGPLDPDCGLDYLIHTANGANEWRIHVASDGAVTAFRNGEPAVRPFVSAVTMGPSPRSEANHLLVEWQVEVSQGVLVMAVSGPSPVFGCGVNWEEPEYLLGSFSATGGYTLISNRAQPIIAEDMPDVLEPATVAAVRGRNFGPFRAGGAVLLNGEPVEVISWRDNMVHFIPGQFAYSGPVSVVVNGVESNLIEVTVNNPGFEVPDDDGGISPADDAAVDGGSGSPTTDSGQPLEPDAGETDDAGTPTADAGAPTTGDGGTMASDGGTPP